MWVIFEGLDKSGKGTLEWKFLKATNFKHIVIDRGPVGYLVFDNLFSRVNEENNKEYAKNIMNMKESNNFAVVYCKVSVDIAMQRLKEHNETCPYNYERAQVLYDLGIERLYKEEGIQVIEVDTSKSIEECIQTIIRNLKKVQ